LLQAFTQSIGLAFNPDGQKCLFWQQQKMTVREYDLSTGFDVSTAVTHKTFL
jgi:hypothetical protein